jgi:hypothetical protein
VLLDHGADGFGSDTTEVAVGDYDRDRALDVVVGEVPGDYRIFRGRRPARGSWIGFRFESERAGVNSAAIGTRATATLSDGRLLVRQLTGGGGFGDGNDTPRHFGLGEASVAGARFDWPDGSSSTISAPEVGRYHVVAISED